MLAGAAGMGQDEPLDCTWEVNGVGRLHFGEEQCSADLTLGSGYRLQYTLDGRRLWSDKDPDGGGPEGWLKHFPLLLPCHYFVHSTGSPCQYTAHIPSLLGGTEVLGRGFAHVEGNHGSSFPEGWVWSQGIGADKDTSLSLVGGKFTIGVVSPLTWVVFFRKGGNTHVFRTTDMDHFSYDVDPARNRIELTATRTLHGARPKTRMHLTIEASDGAVAAAADFGIHIHVPTSDGWSNSPGCRETYTACARVRVSEWRGGSDEWVFVEEEETVIPLAALEFGGSFQQMRLSRGM